MDGGLVFLFTDPQTYTFTEWRGPWLLILQVFYQFLMLSGIACANLFYFYLHLVLLRMIAVCPKFKTTI